MEERLREGDPLSEALRGTGLVPDWVAWFRQPGSARGALAPTLREVAAIYRRQVESDPGSFEWFCRRSWC